MNLQHVISEALVEYDAARPVIRYLQKNTDFDGVKSTNDTVRTKFKFSDKNTNEVIVDTEVETLAIFYDKLDVWSWAWSQTGLTNAENELSKKILMYALKLDPDLSYLKSILTTSRGPIYDVTQIDINLAIASSIIKQPYIYPYIHRVEDQNLIYYIILLNKEELDKLKNKIKNSKESDEYNSD